MRNENIKTQAAAAVSQLLESAQLSPGRILVVGCSTSEVAGKRIGSGGTLETASLVLEGLTSALDGTGVFLAVQCCEHLNRALVVPRACAEKYAMEEVCARPVPNAGGSLAAAYYDFLEKPFMAERISAHAGIDIGGTLIGMHLRPVAVPVRIAQETIGEARLILAQTRPKLIGGERAQYPARIR